ncbi:hypothetical protein ACNQR7_32550 [Mycolicibacterium senegalense]|uniref:hypothetical protein n=1 Tax=Mycolicibacterium senegalense TaxID=1796 RepID=UPI003AABC0B6
MSKPINCPGVHQNMTDEPTAPPGPTTHVADREDVQLGDLVTWGALGYQHQGLARANPELWDGQLTVNGGIDWWTNFISAERSSDRTAAHQQPTTGSIDATNEGVANHASNSTS